MSDSADSSDHEEEQATILESFTAHLRSALGARETGGPTLTPIRLASRLSEDDVHEFALLCERQLRGHYEASGFVWDQKEKETELAQAGSVYLVAGQRDGLLQVKVEREEGRWTAYVWEFVLGTTGTGLGSTMLSLVERAASATDELAAVALTVQHANARGRAFYQRRGYLPYFDSVAHSVQFIEAGVPLPPELHKRYVLLAKELRD